MDMYTNSTALKLLCNVYIFSLYFMLCLYVINGLFEVIMSHLCVFRLHLAQ